MTGISSMSLSKIFYLALCVIPVACAAKVSCPTSVSDGGVGHALNNASLFDGPPDKLVSLVPDSSGSVDRWDLTGLDPYLVCRFENTTKTVTLHAAASKSCVAGHKPFTAYCK
ncbi:STY0301 family protein [Paraburkholderia sp.]|uniref:STY0301 family protein n=1 Tax=Paraburkholderia sp. TaxID=1926495 RepID=UPI003D6F0C53